MKIIKKDGKLEDYDFAKIRAACSKSAARVGVSMTEDDWNHISSIVDKTISEYGDGESIEVAKMHDIVEVALDEVNAKVAKAYRDYRNYKKEFVEMMDDVMKSVDQLNYHMDHSNANTTSYLVSTKRSLGWVAFNKQRYLRTFLNPEELAAENEGYIYIHDLGARLDSYNCCLADIGRVLQGGFEWEHIGYNEPKDVRTACNLISDLTLNTAAMQYGGFTIPEIDSVLAPYAEKSYKIYCEEYRKIIENAGVTTGVDDAKMDEYAWNKTKRDICQGFQGFEHTFNTVASSRGDYPFTTMTGGCEESKFGQLVWECALEVRMGGQGHPGKKRPAIFPKLVFLYTEKLHGENGPLRSLYMKGVECSAKSMYPDWLSLDEPDNSIIDTAYADPAKPAIATVFHKYHKFGVSRWVLDKNNNVQENPDWVDSIISPMGCRAYLSPYYERGGLHPADDNDRPVFHGRFNGGAISLNLPMIYMKAKEEGKDFFNVLDYYLDLIDGLHIKTYDFLCKLKASCNPIAFCEGGFGKLGFNDSIKPLVDKITFSYGFTALNELQELATGQSLYEVKDQRDSLAFVTEKYVADYVEKKKKEREEGKVPYIAAIYGTPAESLCLSGDTLVQTYEGYLPIKDLKAGDLVYSYNETTHKIELKPITFSGKTGTNRQVVKVTFDNGQSIICTPEHEFALRDMNKDPVNGQFIDGEGIKYVAAKDLKPKNRVKSNYIVNNSLEENIVQQDFLAVKSVEYLEDKIDVYDITVQDNHNFFVGGEKGILVHNCGTQLNQFVAKYGAIKNVSDKAYFTNSFHMWVGEEITPWEKQDAEFKYFHVSSGGHIQYCRFANGNNLEYLSDTITRAMKLGYYFGVNIEKSYCHDCGTEIDDGIDVCPHCGSKNITTINRVCGYLGYSRVDGDTKMNEAKLAEIKDRKSM